MGFCQQINRNSICDLINVVYHHWIVRREVVTNNIAFVVNSSTKLSYKLLKMISHCNLKLILM